MDLVERANAQKQFSQDLDRSISEAKKHGLNSWDLMEVIVREKLPDLFIQAGIEYRIKGGT